MKSMPIITYKPNDFGKNPIIQKVAELTGLESKDITLVDDDNNNLDLAKLIGCKAFLPDDFLIFDKAKRPSAYVSACSSLQNASEHCI